MINGTGYLGRGAVIDEIINTVADPVGGGGVVICKDHLALRCRVPGGRECAITSTQWDSYVAGLTDGDHLHPIIIPVPLIDTKFASCLTGSGRTILSFALFNSLNNLKNKMQKMKNAEKKAMDKKQKRKMNLSKDIQSIKKLNQVMRQKQSPVFSQLMNIKCM